MPDPDDYAIARYLHDMLSAEDRHARRYQEADDATFVLHSTSRPPLRCRTCQRPNGPPHAIEANYPDWTCRQCRSAVADRDAADV